MSTRNLHDSHVRRSINPLRNCYDLAASLHEIDSPFANVVDSILETTNSSGYLLANLELLLDAVRLDVIEHTPPDPRPQVQQAVEPVWNVNSGGPVNWKDRPRGQNVAYQPLDVDEYCNEFDAGCL